MVLPMLSEYYNSMTMNFDHAYMYVSREELCIASYNTAI